MDLHKQTMRCDVYDLHTTSSTDTTRKLHIFHCDCDTTGVDCAQQSVLEETHQEWLGSFLEGQEGITLEANPGLAVLLLRIIYIMMCV